MPAWHSPSPRLLPSPSLLFWVAWPEEEEEGETGEGEMEECVSGCPQVP